MADKVQQLREEFRARQSAAMLRARLRQGKSRIGAAIGGGLAGALAVAVTAGVTDTPIYWHSFILDPALCLIAGYLLGRIGGGILRGALLFAFTYLLAQFLRTNGLDPALNWAPAHEIHHATFAHGELLNLLVLLVSGGVLGQIVSE